MIESALKVLENDDVVGLPTETVYGLAARIDKPQALKKIFSIKERPFFDPLIVHVADLQTAKKCARVWPKIAETLAQKFWPGPLTLVLPKADHIDPLITSGLETVGLRCPRHPIAQRLLQLCPSPLAAPSANKFGRTSPTTASHVQSEFGDSLFVLDGDSCEIGIESTILSIELKEPIPQLTLLRSGLITKSEIDSALQNQEYAWAVDSSAQRAPGQMKHHYMPQIPLLLLAQNIPYPQVLVKATQDLLQLPASEDSVQLIKPKKPLSKGAELVLSSDHRLAARELYSELRRLAQTGGVDHLYYRLPDYWHQEHWSALKDRLSKAATLIFDANDISL